MEALRSYYAGRSQVSYQPERNPCSSVAVDEPALNPALVQFLKKGMEADSVPRNGIWQARSEGRGRILQGAETKAGASPRA